MAKPTSLLTSLPLRTYIACAKKIVFASCWGLDNTAMTFSYHVAKMYRMTWNPINSHWLTHSMWLRTANFGSCWQGNVWCYTLWWCRTITMMMMMMKAMASAYTWSFVLSLSCVSLCVFWGFGCQQQCRWLTIQALQCYCTNLEQSFAAYHICSVSSRLLFSLEDILLRTLLPIITVVVLPKWHCHLWTR